MASIDSLIPFIYHERQEPGSMLCAQHALNTLLQGNYFSAPDLSAIAQSLDSLEESYDDDNHGSSSTNMDDTGFFSVQVLENALQVWGLTLVRWRSTAMRAYQDRPHTQLAFILNLHQHWYTLRRFGRMSADPVLDDEPGQGHWFNLNSFLEAPERVSKLYLGMVLQQAETEGYSVFTIVQTDPEAPLALPHTEADDLAATIPESAPSGAHASTSSALPAGFEAEDLELQAALQASLAGSAHDFPVLPAASAGARTPTHYLPRTYIDDEDDDGGGSPPLSPVLPGPADPVAASLARNRAIMERMRREQEYALREGYEAEAAHVEAAAAAPRAQWSAPQAWGAGGADGLRRALAESEALARAHAGGADADADEDEEMDEDYVPPAEAPRIPAHGPRVYDDEDAELQAALRASLESVPPGFTVPSPPPLAARPLAPPPGAAAASQGVRRQQSGSSAREAEETESEAASSVVEPPVEELSMEEIRKRRLARFGG